MKSREQEEPNRSPCQEPTPTTCGEAAPLGQCSHQHRRRPSSFGMQDVQVVFDAMGLKAGDRFLDLGCGRGDYARHAAEIVGPKGKVYAVDKSRQSTEELRRESEDQRLTNLEVITSNITESIPVESGSIDVCLIATVLHILDLEKDGPGLFREVRRVLKTGGSVVTIDCKKEHTRFGPPQHMRVSPSEVAGSIAPFGFQKTDMLDLGNNYLIRFLAI